MLLPSLPSSRRATLAMKERLIKHFCTANVWAPQTFHSAEVSRHRKRFTAPRTIHSAEVSRYCKRFAAPQHFRHRNTFAPQTFFADLPQTFLSQAGWPRPARQQPVACCARSAANDISDCEASEGTVGGCAPRNEPCPPNNVKDCNLLN